MKIPKPRQKENGRWLIEVMADGKRMSKQFDTPEEAIYWAAGIKTYQQKATYAPAKLTVNEAITRYIDTKSAVLSPSTIRGYAGIQKSRIDEIRNIQLNDLTQEKIQRWINALAKRTSPKTVANAHGLLSAVLREYRPDMALHTRLPQKVRPDIEIPTQSELKAIMAVAKGTKYELSIALAVWLGLRQSEIVGLTWDCVKGDTLQIKRAVVAGVDGAVAKGTKSYSGKRSLKMPAYIRNLIEAQPRTEDAIITISGHAIYCGFRRICEKAGVPKFRFHDLRHANASIMLSIGIPDKYSMKRMGHATNNMLKTTYQHTIKEKEVQFDAMLDAELEKILSE
jgi:integrase